jgi:hypothetical protein
VGSSLLDANFDACARYFVRYIQEMKAAGKKFAAALGPGAAATYVLR